MKNILLIKLLLLLAVTVILFSGGSIKASDNVPGELLVKYRAGRYPRHLQNELSRIGWAKVKTDSKEKAEKVREALTKQADILQVECNTRGQFLAEPNDPLFANQWYLPAISVPDAWDISLGDGAIIGLVDSGVDRDHEDLVENILPDGWDFGDDDDDPHDELGHGTQVCGVMAAVQNNSLGISGVAPQSMILPLKISQGNTGIFTDETVAAAIIYAADHGAVIINLSLGWNDGLDHGLVTDAITYAADTGVTVIAAAGNNSGPVWFPAKLERVVAVSAVNGNDQNLYSAYGPELDLVAPGSISTFSDYIVTTALSGGYTYAGGTSFSAAMVSGVAALIHAGDPMLSAEQLREHLVLTADDLGEEGIDELYGYGKVNAYKALTISNDVDGDGIPDVYDNCPNNANLDQVDSYPPGGNGCGDACECHADCNSDQTVNLADLVVMKQEYFRTDCATNPCSADCNWDDQVDLSDLIMMKQEYLRVDCPTCS